MIQCRFPLLAFGLAAIAAAPASASVIVYNNLTPNGAMAFATNQGGTGVTEIETADDFVLPSSTTITGASIIGLYVSGRGGAPSATGVTAEFYNIFPIGSTNPPSGHVPTRVNSPSDVDFTSLDSGASTLNFSPSTITSAFTAANSIQPGGIGSIPNQTTGGSGAITGAEVEIDITFTTPITLSAGHYFFVPQVTLSNGGQFYWLSASRPISGSGTTPFSPDLQVWTRDANLSPDWLRVGTDIVGGATPPTFNAAFDLSGTSAVPEPSTAALLAVAGSLVALRRLRRSRRSTASGSCV